MSSKVDRDDGWPSEDCVPFVIMENRTMRGSVSLPNYFVCIIIRDCVCAAAASCMGEIAGEGFRIGAFFAKRVATFLLLLVRHWMSDHQCEACSCRKEVQAQTASPHN